VAEDISPIIGLAWVAVISGLLFTRGPATRAPERTATRAPSSEGSAVLRRRLTTEHNKAQ